MIWHRKKPAEKTEKLQEGDWLPDVFRERQKHQKELRKRLSNYRPGTAPAGSSVAALSSMPEGEGTLQDVADVAGPRPATSVGPSGAPGSGAVGDPVGNEKTEKKKRKKNNKI